MKIRQDKIPIIALVLLCRLQRVAKRVAHHPIVYHGHAAGPTIGLWDMQGGVPGGGDYLMYDDTAYSLELNCKCEVKSWNITLTFGAETDVLFTGGKTYYLAHRQDSFHLIK